MNSTLWNPMARKIFYAVVGLIGLALWIISMTAPEHYLRGLESIGQIIPVIGLLVASLHTTTKTGDGMPPAEVETDAPQATAATVVVNTTPAEPAQNLVEPAPWPENWPPLTEGE